MLALVEREEGLQAIESVQPTGWGTACTHAMLQAVRIVEAKEDAMRKPTINFSAMLEQISKLPNHAEQNVHALS